MIVLDSSMAAAIVLPDEADPPVAVLERIYAGPLLAPAHWPTEVGNTLLSAQRRGRIASGDRHRLIANVRNLKAIIVTGEEEAIWREALTLADIDRLTLYDAVYLQLAIARGAALATNDGDLIRAARAHGVEILTSLP